MSFSYTVVEGGTITSPRGFVAGAAYAGLKTRGQDPLDLGILYSEAPCTAAGLFTSNKVKAAPVLLSQQRLRSRQAQAIVVNSGCANACTGDQGCADAAEMAALAAARLGLAPEMVLVASTGVIGDYLPMESLRRAVPGVALSAGDGHRLARAIMTTDTVPKEIAIRVTGPNLDVTVAGIAKGAGMIHPDLATLLSFVTTDAAAEANFLEQALRRAADASFNMLTIDGDTSTNDSLMVLANGLAGNPPLAAGTEAGEAFARALEQVCIHLARAIARDGEGATRLVQVTVEGAASLSQARAAARTIAGSSLVKAAVHGADPNWGRVMAALGRSGAQVEESRVDLCLGSLRLLEQGQPLCFSPEQARALLQKDEVEFRLDLNLGQGRATAWGCDLSAEYVTINSAYTT